MFKEKIIIEMKEVFKEIPFGIGNYSAITIPPAIRT